MIKTKKPKRLVSKRRTKWGIDFLSQKIWDLLIKKSWGWDFGIMQLIKLVEHAQLCIQIFNLKSCFIVKKQKKGTLKIEIYYISFSWLFSIDSRELDAVLRAQKIKTNRNGISAHHCQRTNRLWNYRGKKVGASLTYNPLWLTPCGIELNKKWPRLDART